MRSLYYVLIIDNSNEEKDLRQQLQDVFERDWNSSYAHPI